MMENLDNQIGELFTLLDQLGVDDNTLIIFTSDNGPHHEGGHDPEFWDSNGPLRGLKRDLYEGGVRTPFLVRWPGKVEAGATCDHISAFWDILPTMAELTGQPTPEQTDGISMLAAMKGDPGQKRHAYLYWEFRREPGQYLAARAVRMGDWKAVQVFDHDQPDVTPLIELYNLKDDLGETEDIAQRQPDIVQEIQRIMQEASTPLSDERK